MVDTANDRKLRADTRRIMDDYVTLRLLILLVGAGGVLVGGLAGLMWDQINENRRQIALVPAQIETAVQANSAFQVEQRVRVWNRLSEFELAANERAQRQARLEGQIEGLLRHIDRVLDQLTTIVVTPSGGAKRPPEDAPDN